MANPKHACSIKWQWSGQVGGGAGRSGSPSTLTHSMGLNKWEACKKEQVGSGASLPTCCSRTCNRIREVRDSGGSVHPAWKPLGRKVRQSVPFGRTGRFWLVGGSSHVETGTSMYPSSDFFALLYSSNRSRGHFLVSPPPPPLVQWSTRVTVCTAYTVLPLRINTVCCSPVTGVLR